MWSGSHSLTKYWNGIFYLFLDESLSLISINILFFYNSLKSSFDNSEKVQIGKKLIKGMPTAQLPLTLLPSIPISKFCSYHQVSAQTFYSLVNAVESMCKNLITYEFILTFPAVLSTVCEMGGKILFKTAWNNH